MGSKRFDRLYDWVRWGMHIHLECANGPCQHVGIVDAHSAVLWFRLHRWPDSLEAGALRHFRCTRCGSIAGRARPTENAVTVVDFFPADDRGWARLRDRLRG